MAITAPSSRAAVWAESGQTTEPSQGEQQSGFVAGKPPRRKMNWLMNWVDNAVQWILALGVPEYDAGRVYSPGARVIYGDNKYGYMRVGAGTTTNVAPTDASKWMRWGHTDDEANALIDAKLGTISGALAEATITPSGTGSASYRRQMCFPNSTSKLVCFRLTVPKTQGGYVNTVTLSGAAAFGTGAEGVVANLCSDGGHTLTTGDWAVYPRVTNNQEVVITIFNLDGTTTNAVDVEVQVRGY